MKKNQEEYSLDQNYLQLNLLEKHNQDKRSATNLNKDKKNISNIDDNKLISPPESQTDFYNDSTAMSQLFFTWVHNILYVNNFFKKFRLKKIIPLLLTN